MIGGEQDDIKRLRQELEELRAEVEELKAETPEPAEKPPQNKGRRKRPRLRLIKGGGIVALAAWVADHWRKTAVGVLAGAATTTALVMIEPDPGEAPDELRIPRPAPTRSTPIPAPAPSSVWRTSGHGPATIPPKRGGTTQSRTYKTNDRTATTTPVPSSPTRSGTLVPTPSLPSSKGTNVPSLPSQRLSSNAPERTLCAPTIQPVPVTVTICPSPPITP